MIINLTLNQLKLPDDELVILVRELAKDDSFEDLIEQWLEYKKSRKESYKSQKSISMIEKKLRTMSNNNADHAKQIIEESMANNYAGLFPLKNGFIKQVVSEWKGDTEW